MASGTYDIITVGGGLGGSSLAKAMAERGAQVLVLERERQFKDRVRGEQIHPWGVAEMRELARTGNSPLYRTVNPVGAAGREPAASEAEEASKTRT